MSRFERSAPPDSLPGRAGSSGAGGCKYFFLGVGLVALGIVVLAVLGIIAYTQWGGLSFLPVAQLQPSVAGPDIAFQEPAPGARLAVGESVLVFATARDANRVTRVDLWIGDVLAVQQDSPDPNGVTPLSLIHPLRAVAPGTYRLLVRAYNGEGVMGESPVLYVTVSGEVAQSPTEANHIVQPGETPEKIAKDHNTTVESLEEKNPGLDKDVQPGQVVVVPLPGDAAPPDGAQRPAAPAAPGAPGAAPEKFPGLVPLRPLFDPQIAPGQDGRKLFPVLDGKQPSNPPNARLTAPELLEPKVGDCQVTLTWKDTSGRNPIFDILREGPWDYWQSLPQKLPAGTQTYQDKVPNAGTYIYEVVAYADIGQINYRATSNLRQVVVPPSSACIPARTQSQLVYFQPVKFLPIGAKDGALRVTIGEITRRIPPPQGQFNPGGDWTYWETLAFPAPAEFYGNDPHVRLEVNALSSEIGLPDLGSFSRPHSPSDLERKDEEWLTVVHRINLVYRLWVEDTKWTGKGTTDKLPAPNLRLVEIADGRRTLDWGWSGDPNLLLAYILYRGYSCPNEKGQIRTGLVLPKADQKFEIRIGTEPVGCAASYQVSAYGKPGESAPSNTVTANTPPPYATAQVTFKDLTVTRDATSEIELIANEHIRRSRPTKISDNITLPLGQVKFSGQDNVLTVNLERDQTLKLNVQVPQLQCYSGTIAVGAPNGDWKKFGQETKIIQSGDAQGNVTCKDSTERTLISILKSAEVFTKNP